ncbi:MAG: hypothetical protein K2L78_05410, partial [Muribaculaceae bacterium]|nr:hypothetical protein [Muribaculaceae bacterium]
DIDRLEVSGNLGRVEAGVSLRGDHGLAVDVEGEARDVANAQRRAVRVNELSMSASGMEIGRIAGLFTPLDAGVSRVLKSAGTVTVDGEGSLKGKNFDATMAVSTAAGGIDLIARGEFDSQKRYSAVVEAATAEAVDLGALTGNASLGEAEGSVVA